MKTTVYCSISTNKKTSLIWCEVRWRFKVNFYFLIKHPKIHSPIVGIVVTISPNFNLYRIVVFPAASRPTTNRRGGKQVFINKSDGRCTVLQICMIVKSTSQWMLQGNWRCQGEGQLVVQKWYGKMELIRTHGPLFEIGFFSRLLLQTQEGGLLSKWASSRD